MQKPVVILGIVIAIAGLIIVVGSAATVQVIAPNCYYVGNTQPNFPYSCCGLGPGGCTLVTRPEYVNQTIYPDSTIGGIVVLIGAVAFVIGLFIPDSS